MDRYGFVEPHDPARLVAEQRFSAASVTTTSHCHPERSRMIRWRIMPRGVEGPCGCPRIPITNYRRPEAMLNIDIYAPQLARDTGARR